VIVAPALTMAVSIIIYLLFFFSVTQESIMDIAGSSVFIDRVGEQGVLGDIGREFVANFGADNLSAVTDIFEPVIRFGALLGPIIIFFSLIFAVFFQTETLLEKRLVARIFQLSKQLFISVVCMLPWLFFCKVIAFDWSSTDNLNELIARDGDYGIGGGGYLYALVSLILMVAGVLAWTMATEKFSKTMVVMLVVLISILPGWLLLNAGLIDNVGKYSLNFSGVDFLLGPDRKHLLSKPVLFLRWSLLQFCATLALAFGALLYIKLSSRFVSENRRFSYQSQKDAVILSEFKGYFDKQQLEFLEQLSERIGQNLSATVALIIAFVKKEVETIPNARKLFAEELVTKPGHHSGIKQCSLVLQLPAGQMKFITEWLVGANVSGAEVVIKTIDIFMTACQQESLNTKTTA
jgi:hypothetical protein